VRDFLKTLPPEGPAHVVERTDDGFALVRRPSGDPEEFNRLARRAIDLAGEEFVALPRVDGATGYDQVIIIPFDCERQA
jgi:hypothetical protein